MTAWRCLLAVAVAIVTAVTVLDLASPRAAWLAWPSGLVLGAVIMLWLMIERDYRELRRQR